MSKTTHRDTARSERSSVDQRLARLLDSPLLARVVPHLPPETLHQLVQHRGLEACGEVLAAATPEQLCSVLDLDLWRHVQPGRDEQFDVDRFGEWLEVLVDTGESAAARIVASLDVRLVVAGCSRYFRAFDPGTFEPTEASDDEAMDRREMMNSETPDDVLECEVGGYLVRARRTDAWDAIITLLVTLDVEHNKFFHAVMHGCRRLSNSTPERDGLDDLLLAAQQHLHDVAGDRDRRRSRRGYATPADAIARAYFRATDEDEENAAKRATTPAPQHALRDAATDVPVAADDPSAAIDAVVELLADAGITPDRPRALLAAAHGDPRDESLALLRRQLEFLLHHDESAYTARSRELAFLANTLQAGSSIQSRSFTSLESSDAVACICNLGLECWPSPSASAPSHASSSSRTVGTIPSEDTFLVNHDLVTVFQVGWSVLYRDVSLFVSDQLLSTLARLRCADTDTERGIRALRRQLATQREAGTPWRARDAADVLATLDTTAWISVLGLLDECPIVPAALTAVLERRTTPVSPTAFQFISTTAQIGRVRAFMGTLPRLLSSV
jgi:hypothetical protein